MRPFAITMAMLALSIIAAPVRAQPTELRVGDAKGLGRGDFSWTDTGGSQPIRVEVSIRDQRAYVYRGDTLVAITAVSTGKKPWPTPTGDFTVLQKAVTHFSTEYPKKHGRTPLQRHVHGAPMPYMLRLTTGGTAIHVGVLPGYPSSHACVHIPLAFAQKLYAIAPVGTPVSIVSGSIDAGDDASLPMPAPDAPKAPLPLAGGVGGGNVGGSDQGSKSHP